MNSEIGIFQEHDSEFLQKINAIHKKTQSMNKCLCEDSIVTDQECDKIASLAELHSRANQINSTSPFTYDQIRNDPDSEHCGCGCQKTAGSQFSIFTNLQNFSFLGPGVILFFFFIRCLKTMMLMLISTYGIFSLASNILSSESSPADACSYLQNSIQNYFCQLNHITTFNLKESSMLKQMQLWAGFICTIFWVLGFNIVEFLGYKKHEQIDDLLDSTSDYTVTVENLPEGSYHEQELYEYLLKLWDTRQSANLVDEQGKSVEYQGSPLKLKSIQILYNMKQCREIILKIKQLSGQLVKMIIDKNEISQANADIYWEKKKQFIDNFSKIEYFKEDFLTKPEFRAKLTTSCALIQFTTPDQQMEFLSFFTQDYSSLSCSNSGEVKFKGEHLAIKRAPEPSDFIWQNFQKKFSYLRFGFIWGITIIILYAAYALASFVQTLDFISSQTAVFVSVNLQIFNRIIWISLSFLVTYEYQNTKTKSIKSLMGKSLFAQVINVVVVPTFNNIISNKPIYGERSISENSLFYQFIMFFMMFIFYVANPFYYARVLAINIKCLRNKLIRLLCQVVDDVDTIQEIRPVLQFYEGPEFPIAGAYVYMVTAMLHTFFYCHLQPILLLIFLGNVILFGFIMKYLLFRRCKIPELTNFEIFKMAIFAIKLGCLFYAAGSILFITLDHYQNGTQVYFFDFIPSSLTLIFFICTFFNMREINTKVNKMLFRICLCIKRKYGQSSQQKMQDLVTAVILSTIESLRITYQRKESYYKTSALQSLFNYQKQLYEVNDIQNIHKEHEIQQFCESVVKKSKKTQKIQKRDINKKIQIALKNLIFIPASKSRTLPHLDSYNSILISEMEET